MVAADTPQSSNYIARGITDKVIPLFCPYRCNVPDSTSPTIPLSLYVHIPWCIKKCPYCDFNSHVKNQWFDEQRYVDALIADLNNEFDSFQQPGNKRSLSSIFFGGGTPSLFSANAIDQVISHARELFLFDDIEITLEANPCTFEQEKFNDYRHAGINRLSIGVQSFNASHLKNLGRIHDDKQAYSAIETALSASFENINLDLMFGLPEQTISEAIEDIKTACSFKIPHISHYQLTIEENTFFHKHRPVLPENESIWQMQSSCQQILTSNCYQQYEISAYANADSSDLRSKHNLNYWQFGDYIGIGAGAHGKLTQAASVSAVRLPHHKITRRWKHRQPQQYMKSALQGNAVSGTQQLDQKDILFEYLLNTLRLKHGCELENFENNTGLPGRCLKEHALSVDASLLYMDEHRISTTDKGFLFLNDILEQFLE